MSMRIVGHSLADLRVGYSYPEIPLRRERRRVPRELPVSRTLYALEQMGKCTGRAGKMYVNSIAVQTTPSINGKRAYKPRPGKYAVKKIGDLSPSEFLRKIRT